MRARRACTFALSFLLLLGGVYGAAPARAQDVDPDLFAPAASPTGLASIQASDVLPHLTLSAALTLSYGRDLLVGTGPGGLLARLVAGRASAEAAVAVGVLDRLEVAVALPVRLAQWSAGDPSSGGGVKTGLGDLRIVPKFRILRGDLHAGFGLAVAAEVTAPTGRAGARMGEASATFTPRIVADWRSPGGLLAVVNVGYRVRRATTLLDLVVDDEVRLGAGVDVPFRWAGLSALAELDAAIGVGDVLPGQDRISLRRTPVEVRGAVRWRSPRGWIVSVGAGSGVTRGFGSPDLRVFASVGYAVPLARAPAAPEAPPPEPGVGEAAPAGVPVEPVSPAVPGGLRPADVDAFDRAVASDPDPDLDGVPVPGDACPERAEDPDGFEDGDGCPDEDDDRDGIPDRVDGCRLEPEVYNGIADEDGCPDQGAAAVALSKDKLVIADRVYFETGSDVLKPESHAVLRQVAGFLKANWPIRLVRVDGHTDDAGDRERNVDLSERRARQVVAFLVGEGVAPARLDAKGFGPTVPVAPNRTEAGRAQNRRVEFTVLRTVGTEGGR